jgi:hypothetical protein
VFLLWLIEVAYGESTCATVYCRIPDCTPGIPWSTFVFPLPFGPLRNTVALLKVIKL